MKTTTVGLIAGWGRFPIIIARALKENGHRVVCSGIVGHADEELPNYCDSFEWHSFTRIGGKLRFFKKQNVEHVTMAGKVFKTLLFDKNFFWRNIPDWTSLKFFLPVFRSKDRKDDTLLTTVTDMIDSFGFKYTSAVEYAPQLLVKKGILTRKRPSSKQYADINFGWELAKEMGRLDIGQSVAVKGRAVLAVEAVEGTDECIRRAGTLCKSGGFTVVKVAKPNQDMRFDVPTVGLSTLETMHESGGSVLAIEADKTILLDEMDFRRRADELGISVIATHAQELVRQRSA